VYATAALVDLDLDDAGRYLDRLCDQHLLEQRHADRYQFHDLVGAVARDQGGPPLSAADQDAAFCRLIDYYLVVAERADTLITPHRYRISLDVVDQPTAAPDLRSHDDALAWLTVEDDNLSAICRAAGAAGVDITCWQLAYTLKGYYFLTKRWEPWQATHQTALLATQRLQDRRAEAMTSNHLGLAAIEQGDTDAAATWYARALGLFRVVGDEHGEHTALANSAWILFDQGDCEGFLDLSNRSLDFYRRSGSRRNAAITLRGIGLAEANIGLLPDAFTHLGEALETFTELGLALDVAMTLNGLGEANTCHGDHARAVEYHRRAVAAATDSGSIFELARAHHRLGDLASDAGREPEAQTHWHQAWRHYHSIGAQQADELRGRAAPW
jgi:tetratricopeptide (TPR) repeat protein